jgi:hypothetical protein
MSVIDYVNFGSSLSVRAMIKTNGIGGGNELYDKSARIQFVNRDPTPPDYSSMQFYVEDLRTMSMGKTSNVNTRGILHGVWETDFTVTTSDRRLKTSIQPLYQTIAAHAKTRWSETRFDSTVSSQTPPSKQQQDQPIGWLLRELRPVSFKLKSGPEAKYLKFGFIAQELETIFPNLVRNVGGTGPDEGTKAVATQDLIAVLTLALQNLQKEMEKQREWMMQEITDQRRLLDSLLLEQRMRMDRLERAVFATHI